MRSQRGMSIPASRGIAQSSKNTTRTRRAQRRNQLSPQLREPFRVQNQNTSIVDPYLPLIEIEVKALGERLQISALQHQWNGRSRCSYRRRRSIIFFTHTKIIDATQQIGYPGKPQGLDAVREQWRIHTKTTGIPALFDAISPSELGFSLTTQIVVRPGTRFAEKQVNRPAKPGELLKLETYMAEISNLGYFVIGASDLDAWEHFGVGILGLQTGRRVPGQLLTFRADDLEQRLIIEKSPDDDLLAVGWEFDTEDDLEEFVSQLRAAQVPVTEAQADLVTERKVHRLFLCNDPIGFRHEFYVGALRAPLSEPFRSQVLRGGFSTGRLGIGHMVAVSREAAKTVDFYRRALRFRVSDYISGEVAPGGPHLDATFFHTATGRHHSIATAQMPDFPKRIHHLMLEVQQMDDVGLAFDRCVAAGVPILAGLGHHPNDQMFSFYVATPSGFGLEFGWGGVVIDDAAWEIKRYSQLSDWGHAPPASTPA